MQGRMDSMKKAAVEMIDSLSFADYVGVVTFRFSYACVRVSVCLIF